MSCATPTTWTLAHQDEIVRAFELRRVEHDAFISQVIGVDKRDGSHVIWMSVEPRVPRPAYWWVHV